MNRPLAGSTVIEVPGVDCALGVRLAAALAGRILADLGANVVKIEPPQGDPVRRMGPFLGDESLLFGFLNAGKLSTVIPPGPAGPLQDLLSKADGLIADAASAAALGTRLGTGRPAPRRPAVSVLVSMLGADAPPDTAASEFTVMAMGGVLNLVGEPEREPLRLGGHQAAYAAGLSAFTGMVAGWCGTAAETVHVSLLENAVWLNWKNVASATTGGAAPSRAGKASDWPILRCADGWVALVYQDQDWPALLMLTGHDPRLADPALASNAARQRRAAEIATVFEAHFSRFTRRELHAYAMEHRVPLGPVWTPEELVDDPHNVARRFFSALRLPSGASTLSPRLPALWNGQAFGIGAVPRLEIRIPTPEALP